MNGIRFRYNLINLAVILITVALFIIDYQDIDELFCGSGLIPGLILVVSVFLVHAIKAGRLYLALYGSEISFPAYLKLYCKVTPVSVVAPYKLGEFFRMYCYGKTIRNGLKGIVIVLLDRFMDTAALLTLIILMWLPFGGHITKLVYILLIFLLSVLLIYYSFPGVYRFWKQYILRSRATRKKLTVLRILEALNRIYAEIREVSKGRGMILFFLSLLAWTVEIGSAVVSAGLFHEGKLSLMISDYLSAAMGIGQCAELERFVFVSVALLIAVYLTAKLVELLRGGKERI